MTYPQPPAGATWLLERLTLGRTNNSLAGDLMEEYRHGRSRAWYWRQVLMAIVVDFFGDFQAHPILAARAVATGWIILYSAKFLWSDKLLAALMVKLPPGFYLLFSAGFVASIIRLPICVVAGWIVGRFHRQHRAAVVMLFSVSVLFLSFQKFPWTYALAVDTWGDPRYLPYLLSQLVGVVLPPACILFGGLWGNPLEGDLRAQEHVA